MDVKVYIKNKKKIIDKALNKYLPTANTRPRILHKAMRYAVFPGGKRIRPILTIAAFEACKGRAKEILPVACAMEFIHTYTLIHDDLPCMDNDDSRRGKPTCHKKFGEDIALLAGDALLTLAFGILSESDNVKVISEVSEAIGSCGTIGGQVADMRQKTDLDYIATHKTGALFQAAVKSAGIYKGIGPKKLRALEGFGKYLGFTFQLVDDLLDKDGYVKFYGEAHTKKMAELLSKRAKSYLDIFGNRAKKLLDITDLILDRKS